MPGRPHHSSSASSKLSEHEPAVRILALMPPGLSFTQLDCEPLEDGAFVAAVVSPWVQGYSRNMERGHESEQWFSKCPPRPPA